MIQLLPIVLQEEEKKVKKSVAAIQLYKTSNIGDVKLSGIKKLAKQLRKNKLRFSGYPEWVLQSWIAPEKFPAIPLKNNRWLDTQSITNADEDLESDNIVYSGWIVDALGKQEFGTKAINLTTSEDLDFKKYDSLLKFKKGIIQAKKLLQVLDDRKGTSNNGMPVQETTNGLNTPSPTNSSPTPPTSSGSNSGTDLGGVSSTSNGSGSNGFVDLGSEKI